MRRAVGLVAIWLSESRSPSGRFPTSLSFAVDQALIVAEGCSGRQVEEDRGGAEQEDTGAGEQGAQFASVEDRDAAQTGGCTAWAFGVAAP